MKIVTNEGARLLVVSTFYDEDPEQKEKLYYRPVALCNQYEKESSKIVDIDRHIRILWLDGKIPDESVGLRYTIDDVEIFTDKE